MGFTAFEKCELQLLIRSEESTSALRKKELEESVYLFLKNKGLLKQVRDYGIFPQRYYYKKDSAENIVLSKFYDRDFNLYSFIKDMGQKITVPYRMQMDCSFIIIDDNDKTNVKLKFAWAQRSLAFNQTKIIQDKVDLENMLTELELGRVELLRKVYFTHQNQSYYEKSGYRPLRLLSTYFCLKSDNCVHNFQ